MVWSVASMILSSTKIPGKEVKTVGWLSHPTSVSSQERTAGGSEGCSGLDISQRQRTQPRRERSQDVQSVAEILERFQVGSGIKLIQN